MVLQFVGFMGAYRDAGGLGPLQAATIGAVLATWVTFVPCFLWIFLGAPFIERLRGNAAISGGWAANTAAVVGVILNLAIWFGLHVLFSEVNVVRAGPLSIELPVLSSVDWASLTLTLLAVFAIFRLKMSVMTVLLSSAVLGMAWTLAGMR
jgi:chromate transporter